MRSQIFYTDIYEDIQTKIKDLLNSHEEFLSPVTAQSPRAVGDAIEDILGASIQSILGDLSDEYSADFARRAMADIAFTDVEGFYYRVDVKTHRIESSFNMPNLTSVRRLARFYEDDRNHFVILMVTYTIETTAARVSEVKFLPIEFLGWDCLTIGALGWGQIQIANSKNIIVNTQYSRKKWMLEFCDTILEFYPGEIGKIGERIEHFEKVQEYWRQKPDE